MEFKTIHVELKADAKRRRIVGEASVFEEVDSHDDVVTAGAFEQTIADDLPAGRIKYFRMHREPVGRIVHLKETKRHLEFEAEVDEVPMGDVTLAQVKSGTLDASSIGYNPRSVEWREEDERDHGRPIRRLNNVELLEISSVPWGSNRLATSRAKELFKGVSQVDQDFLRELIHPGHSCRALRMLVKLGELASAEIDARRVTRTKLAVVDRHQAWEQDAALERLREWAGAQDAPNAKFRSAFLWHDAAKPDDFDSYKLPIADVVDGELVAVPRGVFEAAGELEQVPDTDREAVKTVIDGYYSRMRDAFGDESILPPWKAEPEQDDLGRVKQFLISRRAGLQGLLATFDEGAPS